jgi:CRP-like cAMP-binding protein
MTTTLGQARAEARRLCREGQFVGALDVYYQILQAIPFDYEVRLKIADVLARCGQPRFAADAYEAVIRHDIHSGHPLQALVACAALEGLGHDAALQRKLLTATYAAGSPKLSHFAAREAPLPADTPLPELDLTTPPTDPFDIVADRARRRAMDLSGSPPYQDQVHPMPLFSELAPEPFMALLRAIEVRRLDDREVVARQGERGEALYLVGVGELRVSRSENGVDHTVARLYENSLFGEMALATGQPRSASVEVVGEADVLEISRNALARMAQELPVIKEVLDRFTRERLIKNLLQSSPLFAPFSLRQRSALLRRFGGHDVEPGTEIIRHGEPGQGLFVVLSGRLDVLRADGRGTSVVFGQLGPGDMCGEMSLVSPTPTPTSATVRAVTPATVLFLARADFEESVSSVPELRSYFQNMAAQRSRDNSEKLGSAALPTDASALDPSTVWLL